MTVQFLSYQLSPYHSASHITSIHWLLLGLGGGVTLLESLILYIPIDGFGIDSISTVFGCHLDETVEENLGVLCLRSSVVTHSLFPLLEMDIACHVGGFLHAQVFTIHSLVTGSCLLQICSMLSLYAF